MSTAEAQSGYSAIKRSGLVWDKVIGDLTAGSSEEVLHVWFVSNWFFLNTYNHTRTYVYTLTHAHREHHRVFHTQVHYKNQICTAWSGFGKDGITGEGRGGLEEEEAVTKALLIIGKKMFQGRRSCMAVEGLRGRNPAGWGLGFGVGGGGTSQDQVWCWI